MSAMSRKIVGYFTPAKSTIVDPCTPEFGVVEEVPSIYISKLGHIVLGLFYSIFMFGYVAFLIWQWTERPTYTEYNQHDSTEYQPIPMRMYLACSNPPYCGDMTFTMNYTGVPGCDQIRTRHVVVAAADAGRTSLSYTTGYDVEVCFTRDPVFTTQIEPLRLPGITVTFADLNNGSNPTTGNKDETYLAQGIVNITDLSNGTEVPLRLINMDTVQVKTLVVSKTVHLDHGNAVRAEAFPIGIQYDGKHPSTRGTFILALAPYVDTINTWRSHWLTIIGTLGSCAMAAWVVFTIMLIIIPLWPVIFPGQAQTLLNESEKQYRAAQKQGATAAQ